MWDRTLCSPPHMPLIRQKTPQKPLKNRILGLFPYGGGGGLRSLDFFLDIFCELDSPLRGISDMGVGI